MISSAIIAGLNETNAQGMPLIPATLRPSQVVRVEQTIRTRDGDWTTVVEGTILTIESKPTGSWYAHGKGDKFWLMRLRIQKNDGELAELNLGEDSVVTILKDAPEAAA